MPVSIYHSSSTVFPKNRSVDQLYSPPILGGPKAFTGFTGIWLNVALWPKKMVRSFWSAWIKSGFNGPQREKVWETDDVIYGSPHNNEQGVNRDQFSYPFSSLSAPVSWHAASSVVILCSMDCQCWEFSLSASIPWSSNSTWIFCGKIKQNQIWLNCRLNLASCNHA